MYVRGDYQRQTRTLPCGALNGVEYSCAAGRAGMRTGEGEGVGG